MGERSAWEVVVIGAGAAGMMAAARAASRGLRTLLLEKNRKLGVKILISGGTRCNVTHDKDGPAIAAAFPKRQGKFLRSALAALTPRSLIEMIEAEGVPLKVEETGKIFPVSDRALDVRDALARILGRSGCEVRSECPVQGIGRQAEGFRIALATGEVFAEKLIVACGGQSYPGCGTTGDGYMWAQELGHTIVPPVPALTPIHTQDAWLKELSGITLPDASLAVADRKRCDDPTSLPKNAIQEVRRGSLLLTHKGLSGPAAMDLSRAVTRCEDLGNLLLLANFTPERTYEQSLQGLREEVQRDGKRQINSVLGEYLPRRLALGLLELKQIDPACRLAELSKRQQTLLAASITRCPIHVAGTGGFRKAEVTAGGVALEEVHSKTMESKVVPACFFAGEVLDIDGPIGGYNFQAAFSTGWLAGSSV